MRAEGQANRLSQAGDARARVHLRVRVRVRGRVRVHVCACVRAARRLACLRANSSCACLNCAREGFSFLFGEAGPSVLSCSLVMRGTASGMLAWV